MTVAAGKGNAGGSGIGHLAEEAREEAGDELVELRTKESLWDAHSTQPSMVSVGLRLVCKDRKASESL